MIYFDNAATSYPKPFSVKLATLDCISRAGGNAGRSAHTPSLAAAKRIYSCRECVSDLFSLGASERVVFTQNATYALNMAIKGLIKKGSHILISDIEHNSVLRPVIAVCQRCGCRYDVFSSDNPVDSIQEKLTSKTNVLICSHVSNVTGRTLPVCEIGVLCRERGIMYIIDASQSAGHIEVNMKKTGADVICAPAHKGLYGIQGLGVALLREGLTPETIIEGGSGSESFLPTMPSTLPERLEAGTLQTPAIAALEAGVKHICKIGIDAIHAHESKLTRRACDMLSSIEGCEIYSDADSGIVSFNLGDIPCEEVAAKLAKYNICVRAGFHCSPLAHKKLGTEARGCVRLSFGYTNTMRELEHFYRAVKRI